jgi:nucleoside-diphosphate-sugar epimerase
MKYKKVLVSGGTGFIGSHLVEALLKKGREVVVLALPKPFQPQETENLALIKKKGAKIVYGDLRDKESLKPAVKNIDVVFHLGGISRPMRILKQEYYDNCVLGTRNILEVARENRVKKFVHVSSVSVLGVSPDGHPLKENEFQIEDSDYGMSKLESEKIALEYYHRYQLPVVIIRPCLVYGPRCLVRLIMFKFVKWGLFPLFNGGQAKMEFVYVDNVIHSLLLAEKNKKAIGEVFNITDGQSYPIKTVLGTIAKELGARPPFIRAPVFIGKIAGRLCELLSAIIGVYPPFSSTAADWMSQSRNVYDCSKAKRILGYRPKVSLQDGVRKSINWYRKQNLL